MVRPYQHVCAGIPWQAPSWRSAPAHPRVVQLVAGMRRDRVIAVGQQPARRPSRWGGALAVGGVEHLLAEALRRRDPVVVPSRARLVPSRPSCLLRGELLQLPVGLKVSRLSRLTLASVTKRCAPRARNCPCRARLLDLGRAHAVACPAGRAGGEYNRLVPASSAVIVSVTRAGR